HLGQDLGAAVQRIERLREARGEAPFDFRHRLRDGRGGDRGCGGADAGRLQHAATTKLGHDGDPPVEPPGPPAGAPSLYWVARGEPLAGAVPNVRVSRPATV